MRLQEHLLKELEQNGWNVTRRQGEQDWRAWFHEIWVLESQRSRHGATLFLTFLTDPQPGNPSPFWIIGTSVQLPENRDEACGEPSLVVTARWKDELPRFVAALNAVHPTARAPDQNG